MIDLINSFYNTSRFFTFNPHATLFQMTLHLSNHYILFTQFTFLRKLFKDIADEDLDFRLVWIVDELVSVFLASDVASIMKNFGKSTKQEDPVVHFYETFLGAYNPLLRKARGVWYTPQPVVNFIVRAVDDVLKSEFGIKEGLADTNKKKIKVDFSYYRAK